IELLEGGLRVTPGVVSVPLVGAIAAGQPLSVPETGTWEGMTPLDKLELPESLVGRRENLFALRVRGLSMIDALIDDGDIVVLEPPRRVENGDMVAVWLKAEQEATLKYLYDEGSRIRLQPANRQMEPLYTSRDNVEVQGRVVAVFRQMR
ncbi:MAG: repressor LexA, partial [Dehalococcoidia bacterium]|nr:repressor LexA [Dehalococcoidia bacterium]